MHVHFLYCKEIGARIKTQLVSISICDNVLLKTLNQTEEYVIGLTTIDGISITKDSRKKVGFVGILSNIKAVRLIYNLTVGEGKLRYLCTYKLSQDPLEHFFLVHKGKIWIEQ